MNKHKKFIKEAYDGKYGSMCQDWKDTILEHYPEFKEEEFKVGDWVYVEKVENGPTWLNETNQRVFKLTGLGPFYATEKMHGNGLRKSKFRKATPKEVEEHLIAEANRRGYKEGVFIITSYSKNPVRIRGLKGYHYEMDEDLLLLSNRPIYRKGQWAEIINTMTKKEAEEKLGCKII